MIGRVRLGLTLVFAALTACDVNGRATLGGFVLTASDQRVEHVFIDGVIENFPSIGRITLRRETLTSAVVEVAIVATADPLSAKELGRLSAASASARSSILSDLLSTRSERSLKATSEVWPADASVLTLSLPASVGARGLHVYVMGISSVVVEIEMQRMHTSDMPPARVESDGIFH